MRPHLLRVTRDAAAFEALIRALRESGERVGWLRLAAPSNGPRELEEAAGHGVLRAVAVGGGRSVAVKPLRGAPVLKDLLREHFRGTAAVLVQGEHEAGELSAAPRLEPDDDGWRIKFDGCPSRALSTQQLIAALRKPHPWNRPESGAAASDTEKNDHDL